MEPAEKPFTGRPGICLRGLRRQAKDPSFLHELLNCRFKKQCDVWNVSADQAMERDMLTDVGKSESYQKLNGAATMQSKSKLFSHNLDRVIIPMEHFLLQGWDLSEVKFDTLVQPWPEEVAEVMDPTQPGTKRRRVLKRSHDTPIRVLTGNGMCSFDLGFLMKCSFLACDHGLFEHAPVPLEEFSFDLTGNDERVLLTKVDMDNLDAYANFEDGEEHPQEEDEIEDGD